MFNKIKKNSIVLFLFNRSSAFRILEAYYGLFRINALLEAGHLLEGESNVGGGKFIEKNNIKGECLFEGAFKRRGRLFEALWYSIIILLYESKINSNFLSFFWRYISFFKYLFIMLIYNCYYVVNFLRSCNFINNLIINQITCCFCCFLNSLLWRSFKCICGGLF